MSDPRAWGCYARDLWGRSEMEAVSAGFNRRHRDVLVRFRVRWVERALRIAWREHQEELEAFYQQEQRHISTSHASVDSDGAITFHPDPRLFDA
jgi:hypothetical protein